MRLNSIPEGFHTVTPYLVVKDAPSILTFLQKAFGAEVKSCLKSPTGVIMNAEVRIGDSMVMLADSRAGVNPNPSMLYLYVEDADAVYASAVDAGGKSVMPPTDQFYGDRAGAIEDGSGNQWWIASRRENLSGEEIGRRASTQGKN